MIYEKNDVLVEILLIDAEMIIGLWQQDGALLNDGQLVRLMFSQNLFPWQLSIETQYATNKCQQLLVIGS